MPIIILMAVGIISFIFAYMLYYKGAYWLISGINFMPREKAQERYDLTGLTRHFGKMLAIIGLSLFLGGIAVWAGHQRIMMLLISSMFIIIPFFMFGAQRYDKVGGKTQKIVNIVVASLMGIIAIFIVSMLLSSSKAPAVYVENNTLVIKTVYGTEVPLGSIEEIGRVNLAERDIRKSNGFNFGDTLRGNFSVEGLGSVLLYQQGSPGDTVLIRTRDKTILINMGSPGANDQLIQLIKTKSPQD